jgi:hypothetical protein
MQGCWNGAFDSMDEVLQELPASLQATRKVNPSYWDLSESGDAQCLKVIGGLLSA